MERLAGLAATLTVLSLLALASRHAGADDEKTPTIKEIMGALTKGPNAALGQTKKALGSQPPDWKSAKTAAVALRSHAPAMAKNSPPRGDKAAYTKKAEAFSKDCLELADALDKEQLKTAQDAMKKLGGSCMGCHREHRPMQ